MNDYVRYLLEAFSPYVQFKEKEDGTYEGTAKEELHISIVLDYYMYAPLFIDVQGALISIDRFQFGISMFQEMDRHIVILLNLHAIKEISVLSESEFREKYLNKKILE